MSVAYRGTEIYRVALNVYHITKLADMRVLSACVLYILQIRYGHSGQDLYSERGTGLLFCAVEPAYNHS